MRRGLTEAIDDLTTRHAAAGLKIRWRRRLLRLNLIWLVPAQVVMLAVVGVGKAFADTTSDARDLWTGADRILLERDARKVRKRLAGRAALSDHGGRPDA